MASFESKSSLVSMIVAGEYLSILSPWRISVDMVARIVSVKKRNWYLIGEDETTIAITRIKSVVIDDLIFGSNVTVKCFGASVQCNCIPREDSRRIRDLLFH